MKIKSRIFTLSLLVMFVNTLVFTGCKKDDETTETPKPTITLQSASTYISSSQTVSFGSNLKFQIIGTPVSGSKLTKFTATVSYDGAAATTLKDSTLSASSFSYTMNAKARTVVGTETYTFTLTDKNGQSSSTSVTITTKAAAGAIVTQTAKLLGSYSNATLGSFYATSTGTVYLQADAKANAASVDFEYYYGNTNKATLAAPNDADAQTVFNTGASALSTWSTKNATKFGTTSITAAQFDAMTDDSQIASVSPTASSVTNVSSGNVVAFQTVGGKKGLIKIGTINTGASGDITITVKVQQ